MPPKTVKWEIKGAYVGGGRIETLLTEGWEPFSATYDSDWDVENIWFRRHNPATPAHQPDQEPPPDQL